MSASSPSARRMAQVLPLLKAIYPNAHCELHYRSPLQLLIATILSAQCTDTRVNQVTPHLFKAFPDAQALATAPLPDIERIIQSTGFFRAKAKNIRDCCRALVERHGGQVPASMNDLVALAGVGRKTANVVLGNAFHLNEGIVVDTHVARLSRRLGFVRSDDPVKIERSLIRLVPQSDWTLFSHLLIWHGRRRCFARKPNCAACELASLCPSAPRAGT
ncbi:MAG: endonuclease III [Verrucomicrobiia bacterium]